MSVPDLRAERKRTKNEQGRSGDRPHPVRRAESPILPYDQIPPELAESIRGVINRHELRAGKPLPHTIAVTSAQPGEGVTTVSHALATIAAQELGAFVCWVDFGWLKPNAPEPATPRPNLIDILADNSRLGEAFLSSPDLPQLVSMSPSPLPEANRNRVVRSPEFERLLDLLAEEFDHIIFDLPALLTNANALAPVRLADASLLVVRHRTTGMTDVRRAMVAMEPTPNLAVILNRFQPGMPSIVRRLLGD